MKKRTVLACLTAFVAQAISGCCLCHSNPPPPPLVVDQTGPPQKFAVLASAEKATKDDTKENSEFWYDLVLTYCTLLDHGFESDNIYVLYGDGEDAAFSNHLAYSTHLCGDTETEITDFALMDSSGPGDSKGPAKDNLCNVLCCLANGMPATLNSSKECECLTNSSTGIGGFTCSGSKSGKTVGKLRENDYLITWIKGHGNALSCSDVALSFGLNQSLNVSEVAEMVKNLKPNRRTLLFETCDAGGWLGQLDNPKTVVTASTGDPDFVPPPLPPLPTPSPTPTCDGKSWAATYNDIPGDVNGVIHGRFTYGINSALRQLESVGLEVDADDNNLVSILEGYSGAEKRIDDENAILDTVPKPPNADDYGGQMHPAIRVGDNIAPCLFIRLPNPGKDDEAFTKDYEDDNALVPSTPSSNTPDLWVCENTTDNPKVLNVNTGNHHLCARVHNIGCADPGPVKVKFTITQVVTGGPITKTETFGSIPNLPPATSSTAVSQWTAVSMGTYRIQAELTAGTDLPIASALIGEDNNKAEIQVMVVTP